MASLTDLKIGFWLVVSGRASKSIPKGMEKGRIFVGQQKSPIAIIVRNEVQGYLTDTFWSYYQIWSRFNSGFGLPYGGGWADYPEHLITVLQSFENEWRVITNGK